MPLASRYIINHARRPQAVLYCTFFPDDFHFYFLILILVLIIRLSVKPPHTHIPIFARTEYSPLEPLDIKYSSIPVPLQGSDRSDIRSALCTRFLSRLMGLTKISRGIISGRRSLRFRNERRTAC